MNTQYCIWTHGTSGKPQDGFYLLRAFEFTEDESPEGHDYVFRATLFFMGTNSQYQDGARAKNMEDVTNDWRI